MVRGKFQAAGCACCLGCLSGLNRVDFSFFWAVCLLNRVAKMWDCRQLCSVCAVQHCMGSYSIYPAFPHFSVSMLLCLHQKRCWSHLPYAQCTSCFIRCPWELFLTLKNCQKLNSLDRTLGHFQVRGELTPPLSLLGKQNSMLPWNSGLCASLTALNCRCSTIFVGEEFSLILQCTV